MKNLKHIRQIVRSLVLTLVLLLTFNGCTDDDQPSSNLGSLEVKLKLADGLGDISLSNIEIKLVNSIDNSSYKEKTNADAIALFENLPVGAYNISIEKSTDEYIVSGTASNVYVAKHETSSQTVTINASVPNGGLVIKEIYSGGAGDGYVTLFKDQFIEIFNNSSETIYADGIYIANLYGEGGTHPERDPITKYLDNSNYVYADAIDRIPGSGKDYPIEPSKSIVIALNAINFKENNPKADKAIDNTDVTLERYSMEWLESKGRKGNKFFDFDNPSVPNMTNIYIMPPLDVYLFNAGVTGAVIIDKDATFTDADIVEFNEPIKSDPNKLMKIPVDKVIDGVDCLYNSQSGKFKRIPAKIDAGFHFLKADGGAFYTGMSSRRKIDEKATQRFGRVILQDTNNSSLDFEALDKPDKYGYN